MKLLLKTFFIGLGIIAVVNLVAGYRLMMASTYFYPVIKAFEQQAAKPLDAKKLEELNAYIDKALMYNKDPEFLEKKGRILMRLSLLEYSASNPESESRQDQFNRSLNEALDHFEQSISLRPAWATTYIFYAYTKGLMGEFDNDFYRALNAARRYGNNAYEVQAGLTQLGLNFWSKMDVESRLDTKESFIKSYRIAPGRTSAYAPNEEMMYMTCLWVLDVEDHSAECRRLLKLNKQQNNKTAVKQPLNTDNLRKEKSD